MKKLMLAGVVLLSGCAYGKRIQKLEWEVQKDRSAWETQVKINTGMNDAIKQVAGVLIDHVNNYTVHTTTTTVAEMIKPSKSKKK